MGNIERRRPQSKQIDPIVGYACQPQHGMWKPGQSGNPKGRPKGSRNFKTDVHATLRALVQITRDGKARKVSTQSAVLLRLREKALKGDARAIEKLLELAKNYNSEELATSVGFAVEDEKVLQVYRQRLLSGAAGENSELPEKTIGGSDKSGASVRSD